MITLVCRPGQRLLAAAMTTIAIALVGCSSPPDDAPAVEPTGVIQTSPSLAAVTQVVQNDGAAIQASRTYYPTESSVSGFASVGPSETFVIPAPLPVIKGNAGNGIAHLDITIRPRGSGLFGRRRPCALHGFVNLGRGASGRRFAAGPRG